MDNYVFTSGARLIIILNSDADTYLYSHPKASVALSRISTFLDEDEVSDEVSALKTTSAFEADDAELSAGLAIENGSFKWRRKIRLSSKHRLRMSLNSNYATFQCPSPRESSRVWSVRRRGVYGLIIWV